MEKDKGFVYHANRQFTVVTKNTNQQSNFVSHLFKHQWTFTKTKSYSNATVLSFCYRHVRCDQQHLSQRLLGIVNHLLTYKFQTSKSSFSNNRVYSRGFLFFYLCPRSSRDILFFQLVPEIICKYYDIKNRTNEFPFTIIL